tara:strand:- start:65 stop:619 length:555 start_codon:yes stop_codon:yes gene_type:complete
MNCEEYDVCGGVVCDFPIEPPPIEEKTNIIDSLILTPIAKKFKPTPKANDDDPNDVAPSSPDSKRDYGEQLQRMGDGMKPMWDDSKFNKSKSHTTLFGFVFNNECVRFHLIEQVLSPENRLISWSQNVGHGTRNVLELSNMIYEMEWNVWLKLGGHKKVQGTQALANKSALEQIIDHINNQTKN